MLREGVVVGVTDAIDALGGSMRDARASAAPVAVAPASASTSAVERMPLLGAGRTRAAAADSAAAGVRARGVAPSLRAALVACATLAVAAVVGVSLGASRASPVGRGDVAFASLGAAGKKLGSGVRAERAGSATEVPGKPTPLEAFNPFADARGLKLDPRKLPPLTPAGLAKSQRATMMVDQVNAQWLRSSADAAREDGETHDAPDGEISGDPGEGAESAARVPGSNRGGGAARAERVYDDDGAYDARDDDAYYDDARAEVSRRRRRRAFRRSRSAVPPRDRYDSDVDGGYHREHRAPTDWYHREPTDGYREPARRRASPGAAGGGVILGGGRGGGGGFAARQNDWLDDRYDDGRAYDGYDDGREYDGFDDGRKYDGFDVPSPRGRHGGGFKTRERERLTPRARQKPFSFDPDPEATARSRSRTAAVGTTSRSFAGARACVLKRGVTDAQAQAVLDYACDPARRDAVRGFSCAAIKKGGAAFIPNTKRDHASWAVSRFFQARLRERDAFPQQDCHFSGVATLDAFPGNFYLTADGGLRSANDALDALVTRTPVNEGGVVFETAEPFGGSLVDRVTGAWSETLAVPTTLGETNRLGSAPLDGDVSSRRRLKRRRDEPATTFKFWAGAAPGTGGGCMVETSVSYDFDGDGTVDRVEHFQPQGVPEEPDLIPVESAVLGGDVRFEGDAYWTGVTNARARLSVRSPNCPGAVRVWESAEMYPSFLTVPYDAE